MSVLSVNCSARARDRRAGLVGGAQGGTEDGGGPVMPPQTTKDPDYKMAR
jgi:hypothetical protein